MAYTIFNINSAGERYVSDIFGLHFSEERLNAYKEHFYQYDPFVRTVQSSVQMVSTSNSRFVWHLNDLPSINIFYESEYWGHLSETGLRYQAVLSGPKYREYPSHVISIFKTTEEGDFTQEELDLLNLAGNIFNSNLVHYLKMEDDRLRFHALADLSHLQNSAVCIYYGILPPYETSMFRFYKNLLFPRLSTRDILWHLTDNQDPMIVLQGAPITKTVSCDAGSFRINLRKGGSDISMDEKINSYILMEIHSDPNKREPSPAPIPSRNGLLRQYSFTERELDVIALLERGYTNQQIAQELFLSIPTVKTHIGNIFKKLGVTSRGAAISAISQIHRQGI